MIMGPIQQTKHGRTIIEEERDLAWRKDGPNRKEMARRVVNRVKSVVYLRWYTKLRT
jgi:hypothetical protein